MRVLKKFIVPSISGTSDIWQKVSYLIYRTHGPGRWLKAGINKRDLIAQQTEINREKKHSCYFKAATVCLSPGCEMLHSMGVWGFGTYMHNLHMSSHDKGPPLSCSQIYICSPEHPIGSRCSRRRNSSQTLISSDHTLLNKGPKPFRAKVPNVYPQNLIFQNDDCKSSGIFQKCLRGAKGYFLRVLDLQENYCRIQSYCRIFEPYHADTNRLLLTYLPDLPCFCQKY